jgi:hypothetical protein
MDEKMNFSEHVDVMFGKAFAVLGFIRWLSINSEVFLNFLGSSEAEVRQLCMESIQPTISNHSSND